MPVAYTSRLAYQEVQESLVGCRRRVWQAIRDWRQMHVNQPGPTIEDLAQVTGLKECSVCGRLNELRDLGAVEDGPLWTNRSGKRAKTYRALVYRPEPAESAPRQACLDFGPPWARR